MSGIDATNIVTYFAIFASIGTCYLCFVMLFQRQVRYWWFSIFNMAVNIIVIGRLFSLEFNEKIAVHFRISIVILILLSSFQIILTFASLYKKFGLKIEGGEVFDPRPWDCLYLSIVTWTTVGYGDILPSPRSRPFAAAEALAGYLCMALIIGATLKLLGG